MNTPHRLTDADRRRIISEYPPEIAQCLENLIKWDSERRDKSLMLSVRLTWKDVAEFNRLRGILDSSSSHVIRTAIRSLAQEVDSILSNNPPQDS